jgi:acetolactate decarboxylase
MAGWIEQDPVHLQGQEKEGCILHDYQVDNTLIFYPHQKGYKKHINITAMKKLIFVLSVIVIAGCATQDHDNIFHYSVLKALDNGVLEGSMTLGELKQHGGLGLGTFNGLNGELIADDGVIYRVDAGGEVTIPEDGELTPYAVVCFYEEDHSLGMEGGIDYPSLKRFLEDELPSRNLFYGLRIRGTFEYIKCGGASLQERPYNKSIAQMLEGRPIFEAENISGTLVGFWCPDYIGDINTSGPHLHFLADDHSIGGHLMEFSSDALQIGYDTKTGYSFVLPENDDLMNAHFRDEEVDY